MVNFVSPGSYVIEKDNSDYPSQLNSSVVGIVGFASRGPIAGMNNEKATLITSQQDLIDTFGEPSEGITGQALEGALEILEVTRSLRFIRAADSTATEASAAVPLGGCPALLVSGTATAPVRIDSAVGGMSALGSADSTTSDVRFVVTTYDNTRTKKIDAKTYEVPANTLSLSASNGATTISALKKVFGGAQDVDNIGAFADSNAVNASSFLVGLQAGSGATVEMTMEIKNDAGSYVGAEGITPLDYLGSLGTTASSITSSGTSVDTTSVSYLVKSLWAGNGYNAGTKVDGTTSGVSFEVGTNGGSNIVAQINDQGAAAETFIAGATSSSFLENKIGTTYDSRTSQFVTANFASGSYDDSIPVTSIASFEKQLSNLIGGVTAAGSDGTFGGTVNPRFVKLIQGTYNLAGGDSGIPTIDSDIATAVIGEVKSDGGKTGIEALDDPILNISMALAPGPGVGDLQSVQNALITKAEATTDFIALVSPPYAVGKTGDAIDWHNGFSTSRTAAINSSYASITWPWVKVFQVFDGRDRWLAPEIYKARQMCFTDAVADPWFAAAGFVRGRLTKPVDVEVVLNQGDRDSLYSGGNAINPIVNFPQNGIAIFGQRTAQRQPTSLDRENIRRLMISLKKQILAATARLAFEPNDKFTWSRVEQVVGPLLDNIARRRGITEFQVTCDETTNTPIRVDRNEMWCKIQVKPTKTAEIVVFEVNLTNQSAELG